MTRIQYASDLHLEFPKNREFLAGNPLQPSGDILILAGDIVTNKHRETIEPLYARWRKEFQYIISIPGNHEFYGDTVMPCYPSYKRQLAENHILLNNETLVLDGIRFIASILWTHVPPNKIPPLERASNDYRLIEYSDEEPDRRTITGEDVNEFHAVSRRYLESELQKPFAGKTVVITHHLPSYTLMGFAAYSGILKYYCASNLNKLIQAHEIDHWVFGHFHQTVNRRLFDTTFVSNPLGYMNESQYREFSPSAHFGVR